MKKLIISSIAALGLIGTSAFAADMPVKAPPPAPAPVPSWTGFYAGIQFGVGWSDNAVDYSANDPMTAQIFGGTFIGLGAVASGYRVPQKGPVGGFEAGYNWQWSNWVLGLETDFSFAGMSGTASGTSVPLAGQFSQTTTAQQSTDWYGTVRGRLGWLATPNLLLFGTGGFAYGRVSDSASWLFGPGPAVFSFTFINPSFSGSLLCFGGVTCFAGSSSGIRTGWTAGGGIEWLLDQHWTAKVEYQFVDLGSETVRIVGTACPPPPGVGGNSCLPTLPASTFNAAFRDSFNVVRLGLNYRF